MKISKALGLSLSLWLLLSHKDYAQQLVDVDTYTGSAITTIPLYTLKSGSLSFPIELRNVSNAIKPNDATGLVGTGWNISTGGSISRQLRGLPDDYYNPGNSTLPAKQGWLYNNNSNATAVGSFVPAADTVLTVATDEQADYNFLNSLGGFTGNVMNDTEPDIFSINTPAFSCNFVFDNSGMIAFLGKQDFKITYQSSSNGITGFTVIDDNGNTYVFGEPMTGSILAMLDPAKGQTEANITHFKYQYYLYKTQVSYYAKWKLLSMQSPNGDRITFEYNSFPNQVSITQNNASFVFKSNYSEPISVYVFDEATQSTIQKYQYTLQSNVVGAVQLTKATARAETVLIKPAVIDVPVADYWLTQVLVGTVGVYDMNASLTRTFTLNYTPVLGHIFLKSVTESALNTSRAPYFFEYNGVNLDTKTMLSTGSRSDSFFEDEFGYQNLGVCCELPAAYRAYTYPSLFGGDRIRNQPLPNYVGNHIETGSYANDISVPNMLISTLSKITLPSGGVNRIFYEPNFYKDSVNFNGFVSSTDVYGGGHRVSRLEFHDGVDYTKDIIKYYSYKQSNGKSSGVLLYRPLRTFNLNSYKNQQTNTVTYYNDLINQYSSDQLWKRTLVTSDSRLNGDSDPGTFIGYKKVTISQTGIGSTVYEYDIPAAFGKKSETDWVATKNRIARNTSFSGATSVVAYDPGPILGYYAYPFAPNPNYDFKRGLLRHVSVYSNANFLVSRTDYDYTYSTSPTKVYGIRLDQYPALMTYSTSSTTVTNAFPMFIYCRYEMNTNIHALLQKTTTKVYDQSATGYQTSSFQTNIETREYSTSANHDRLIRRVQTSSDGTELATNYKYTFDYSPTAAWAQQDTSTQAITKLKEKNIYAPIETWTTKREGTDGSPLVTSASLSLFLYDPVLNTVSLRKTLSTATFKPYSSFTPSSIDNGTNSTFKFDNKYNRTTKFLNPDTYGNARTTIAFNKTKASVHYTWNNTAIRATFANAAADEVAFSDFEPSANDFAFSKGTGAIVTGGRVNGYALLMTGSRDQLSSTLKKGQGDGYIFSFWAQSTTGGTITVNVRDNANVQVSKQIPYPVCTSWTYFSARISTTSLTGPISVAAQSDFNVNLDDVLFYPATAIPNTTMYGRGGVKLAETDGRGVTTYYEYDDFNQLCYIRDQDQNIVKSMSYQIGGSKVTLPKVEITSPSTIYFNQQVNFAATTDNALVSSTSYKWKVTSDPSNMKDFTANDVYTINGSNVFPYTFPYVNPYDRATQKFSWKVRLLTTYNGVNDTTGIISVSPNFPPLTITICADRPAMIDLCNAAVPLLTDCNPSAAEANGLTLIANVSGGSGNYSYAWQRSDYPNAIYPAGTASVYNEPDYRSPRQYTLTVSDLNTQGPSGPILMGNAVFTVQTFKSDPNCSIPNGN